MIIGLTGTIGSGKGTVTEYLKSKGFAHYSSSALLGELVDAEGNPKTREFLSKMATRLQEEYPGGVVEKNYREKFLVQKPEHAVFEAIHRKTEANFLQSIGGIIIGVDAGLEERYTRTVLRNEGEKDRKSFEDFKEQARVEDEGGGDSSRDNNIRAVLEHADAVIMNNTTLEDLHRQIEEVLAKLS
ncbi:MAG: putative dephospho-CoA kinase [Parcubacteria bacterium C7867-004]|nr:MAG: putative dephospho-CoA kinase [Parcubacteria bacterium C7867-004]